MLIYISFLPGLYRYTFALNLLIEYMLTKQNVDLKHTYNELTSQKIQCDTEAV